MGFSWRRSFSLGPVRLNMSPSGVGASVGVRGARVSVGPRGTYVHLGTCGLRYTQKLGMPSGAPTPQPQAPQLGPRSFGSIGPAPPIRSPAPNPPRPTPPQVHQLAASSVEVIDPSLIVASTADSLLDEIRRASGSGNEGLSAYAWHSFRC